MISLKTMIVDWLIDWLIDWSIDWLTVDWQLIDTKVQPQSVWKVRLGFPGPLVVSAVNALSVDCCKSLQLVKVCQASERLAKDATTVCDFLLAMNFLQEILFF